MIYVVASGPAIWQRTIEQIVQGLPGVKCILDDVCHWINRRRAFVKS